MALIIGLSVQLVSKVLFRAFFEMYLLIPLKLHVGHTNFLDFNTLS